MDRVFNFASGPAMLPLDVLEKAKDELLNYNNTGMSIMEIPYINIKVYRNNSGEKYKSCHFCNSRSPGKTVYITPEGDGYHTIQNCIGLTRSIYTVPISRVKGKRVCQGCRK